MPARVEFMIGERIVRARLRKGMSQQELADRIGAAQRSVGSWERGGAISTRYLVKLSEALDIDLSADEDPPLEATAAAELTDDELVYELRKRLQEARAKVTQLDDVIARLGPLLVSRQDPPLPGQLPENR